MSATRIGSTPLSSTVRLFGRPLPASLAPAHQQTLQWFHFPLPSLPNATHLYCHGFPLLIPFLLGQPLDFSVYAGAALPLYALVRHLRLCLSL